MSAPRLPLPSTTADLRQELEHARSDLVAALRFMEDVPDRIAGVSHLAEVVRDAYRPALQMAKEAAWHLERYLDGLDLLVHRAGGGAE